MDELKEIIDSINDDFRDINAILAVRSRELDRREQWDKEISELINSIRHGKKQE